MGRSTEPDLRGSEGITLDAASLPTQHGVNGTRPSGTRDSATVSPLAIVSAPALTLVTATEPLGGYSWQRSGPGFGTPGLNVGGGGT